MVRAQAPPAAAQLHAAERGAAAVTERLAVATLVPALRAHTHRLSRYISFAIACCELRRRSQPRGRI